MTTWREGTAEDRERCTEVSRHYPDCHTAVFFCEGLSEEWWESARSLNDMRKVLEMLRKIFLYNTTATRRDGRDEDAKTFATACVVDLDKPQFQTYLRGKLGMV